MRGSQFDWRWLILVIVVLLFFGQLRLSTSPIFGIALLGLCTYWMFLAATSAWQNRQGQFGPSNTYWRGQRVTPRQATRSKINIPAPVPLIASIGYLAVSVLLAFSLVMHVLSLVR